jgi:site-specific DNA-methyltransferase (adenine-specific)
MKAMPDNSVDAIVTDPPYELGFMGKSWDASGIAFNIEVWQEALRVIKPGGHLIAFSGSRTYHRMAVAIEDAGFEIRDQIMWVYGSGFPKSLNIAKALDKSEGLMKHEGKGMIPDGSPTMSMYPSIKASEYVAPEPIGKAAKQWQGWGTALKPAHEPMVLARKPIEGTVANNVLTYGVGGLNIEGTRVEGERWPANFIHDGFETDWAKFFYCSKASKRDRNEGTTNHHPTVKPTTLMQYLVRLVTPPNGIVFDPFMGSGSTGKACAYEGFDFVGIDQSAEYVEIAQARIDFALANKDEL